MECARSRETVKRSQLADAADYGYCTSHSRFFWGFRLHALLAPDGTTRALSLASPKRDEREVALEPLARARRVGGEVVVVLFKLCLGFEAECQDENALGRTTTALSMSRAARRTAVTVFPKPGGAVISSRRAQSASVAC